MRNILLTTCLSLLLMACNHTQEGYKSFNDYPVPSDPINEMEYSPKETSFSVWAPTAEEVELMLFDSGSEGSAYQSITLVRQENGCWTGKADGDLKGKFYDFNVNIDNKWRGETPGLFAKAVGANGQRAAILDIKSTDPAGWSSDVKPSLAKPSDLVVYEMHMRDISVDSTSGIKHRGKYLAMTEHGTHNVEGEATGIDHIKELGVNAVQLMPVFDFGSIDETNLHANKYNWGYDPVNYNVPEGSYSTDPSKPEVRIREFKQMVQSFHKSGLRVIMDVVYNHTFSIKGSNYDMTVPGYFYRNKKTGKPANGSGCGNETASERAMLRKFMVESVSYWVQEYHIDGFRFDLMGVHDIETMREIRKALDEIDPTIVMYGEGWGAEAPQLPEKKLAMKANINQIPGVGAFSDELRDALRGPFNNDHKGAFLAGISGEEESVKFGIVGGIDFPEIKYDSVNYSKHPWALQPSQMISYASCHDDMCLADRLRTEMPTASPNQIMELDKLAQTAVFTSQGIPFIYAGEELFRTKQNVHNSFNSPDATNAINWEFKHEFSDLYSYYRGLILMRKLHPAFRMGDASLIRKHLHFMKTAYPCLVAFTLSDHANNDEAQDIVVALNGAKSDAHITIDGGWWHVIAHWGIIDPYGNKKTAGGVVTVPAQSALILYR